eukprot:350255-Chlamydomonas_euryale.AAC.38
MWRVDGAVRRQAHNARGMQSHCDDLLPEPYTLLLLSPLVSAFFMRLSLVSNSIPCTTQRRLRIV